MAAEPGQVFIVGAGPGNPGFLTLRAIECLEQADVVLRDDGVPERLLDFAPIASLHNSTEETVTQNVRKLADAWAAGKTIVRLCQGEPNVTEQYLAELAQLRAVGIPYEIVPAISQIDAAHALGEFHASCGQPVIRPAYATEQSYSLQELEWSFAAGILERGSSFTMKVAVSQLGQCVQTLLDRGIHAEVPAAVVLYPGAMQQTTMRGTLRDIPWLAASFQAGTSVVLLLGAGVNQVSESPWVNRLSLRGCKVIVTRPRPQAARMLRELECRGAEAHLSPVMAIGPSPDPEGVANIVSEIQRYDWLVFTSVNGVAAFVSYLRQVGKDVRALGHLKLATIGPGTAAALEKQHLRADVVPSVFRSEELAATLSPLVRGQRVLLARADRGRDVLPQALSAIAEVTQIAVYAQVDTPQLDATTREWVTSAEQAYITLTSANIARQVLKLLPDPARQRIGRNLQLVSISPVTTEAVNAAGFAVAGEAREYTVAGVVKALEELAAPHKRGVTSAVP